MNPGGNHPGLPSLGCLLASLLRLLRQQQFTAAVRPLRVLGPHIERRLGIILYTALVPAHQIHKDTVYRVQHLPAASEISAQIDALAAAVLMGVGLVFFQKKFRPCQTELIDALFHVSHHKTIEMPFRLAGYRPEQILLHQVAVLILVYQYLMKILPILPGHGTGQNLPFLSAQQNLQGIMLDIGEIHKLFLLLARPESLPELHSQFRQHTHRGLTGIHLGQTQIYGRGEELLPHLLQSVLHPAPESFRQFPLVGGHSRVLFYRQSAETHMCQTLRQTFHDHGCARFVTVLFRHSLPFTHP